MRFDLNVETDLSITEEKSDRSALKSIPLLQGTRRAAPNVFATAVPTRGPSVQQILESLRRECRYIQEQRLTTLKS